MGVVIAGLLVVVSLSPVRGPGPRATRLEALAETVGQRARLAVLLADGHEDAALSARTLEAKNASGAIELWPLPAEDHGKRYNQWKAMVFAFRRARRDPSVKWTVWANDHTFLVAENLACYLARFDASQPHYLGMRMWGPCCGLFNSGAAGFAVSRGSLDLLGDRWAELDADPSTVDDKCGPDRPKAHVATCLAKLDAAATPADTRDGDGAERFLVYGPVRLATGAVDQWLVSKKANMKPPEPFPADGSVVASEVISFHYCAADEHRLLHALLHDGGALLASGAADAKLAAAWPEGREKLGGYSAPWPKQNRAKAARVLALLRRLRLCDPPDRV